jgi:hypothetical protein
MRDVGALSLALTVVLFVAAITMEQLIVRAALITYLLFAIPHLLFHVTHHQHDTAGVAVTETTGLVVAVLLPIAVLILQLRDGGSPERPPIAGPPSVSLRRSRVAECGARVPRSRSDAGEVVMVQQRLLASYSQPEAAGFILRGIKGIFVAIGRPSTVKEEKWLSTWS